MSPETLVQMECQGQQCASGLNTSSGGTIRGNGRRETLPATLNWIVHSCKSQIIICMVGKKPLDVPNTCGVL